MKRLGMLACAAALFLSACGGGGSEPSSIAPMQPSSTNVQVNIGDAPSDALLAAAVTLNSLTITRADGSSVTVVSEPQTIEMLHLMGTVMPLALKSLPLGTYTASTLVFGDTTVTYIDPATGQTVQKTVSGPVTYSLQFSPPLTVGATPLALNLDLDLHASIHFDASGNLSMTPVVKASFNQIQAGSPYTEDGGMHGFIGAVNGIGGNGFTLAAMQGLANASCAVDGHTQFGGLPGLGMMAGTMLVAVDAMPQADGTWLVSRVQSRIGAGGSMGAGLVTTVTTSGSPPQVTQLVLAMQQGLGNGMVPANLAATTTVAIDNSTTFAIDTGLVDLTNLPFTTFDRASIHTGQRVMAFSSAPMGHHAGMGGMHDGGSLTATSVYLREQGLRGTVSNYTAKGNTATFTLTLPPESAFAKLTGAGTVTVYQQPTTQLLSLPDVHNSSTIVVRGLLFVDSSNNFRLVASRILAD